MDNIKMSDNITENCKSESDSDTNSFDYVDDDSPDLNESDFDIIDFEDLFYDDPPESGWSAYFRKTWNITTIFFVTAVVYLYFVYKRDNKNVSKF
jgi:hypothetical protein